MAPLKHLPIAGKYIGRGIKISTVIHIVLLCCLILLGTYSQARIDALTKEKELQTQQEKKEKIENAIAEQQLKQDIKEVLKELNPKANAEELAELQKSLEEKIDKEKLKDQLIASMEEDKTEEDKVEEDKTEEGKTQEDKLEEDTKSQKDRLAQHDNETYIDELQKELANNLEAAIQDANEKLLEDELLEELVYQDLPEIDNNLENALKRDSLEELTNQALKDQAHQLADSAKKLLSQTEQSSKPQSDLHKQLRDAQKNNTLEAQSDESTNHIADLAKQALKHVNHTDQANAQEKKDRAQALNEREQAFKQAQEAEAQALKAFKEIAKASIKEIVNRPSHETADSNKTNKLKQLAKQTNTVIDNDSKKPHDIVRKISELRKFSNAQVSSKTEEKTANDQAVSKASVAKEKHQKAAQALNKARSELLRKAAEEHRTLVHHSNKLIKRFERNKELSEAAKTLKAALQKHRKNSNPKNMDQLKQTKTDIEALSSAQQQFTKKLSEQREQTVSSMKQQIKDLNQLQQDIAALKAQQSPESQDQVLAAIKDTLIQDKIEEKSQQLSDILKKDQADEGSARVTDFKQRAQAITQATQASQDSNNAQQETSKSQQIKIGKTLQQALARKVTEASGTSETSVIKEKPTKPTSSANRIGFRGIDVESSKKSIESIASKWQFRKLSLEEKKKILSKNNVATAQQAPPQLRFARPTLEASNTNPDQPSSEIFVGEIKKREIATLDPNRPIQIHSQYKDADICAVRFCQRTPTLDGDSADWDLERTRLRKGKDVFMQWRPDGLYVLAIVRDQSGQFEKNSVEIMTKSFWEYDTMELWFDMKNSKAKKTDLHACQQFWACPQLPGIQRPHQLWEVVWGNGTRQRLRSGKGKQYIGSQVHDDQKGYNLEMFIPRAFLTNLNYFRAGQVIGFLYVINSSHNPNHMQSSLKEFNPHFHYSSQPSSWGNLQLLGTDAALNTLTADGQATEYPLVEVSKALGLMVNDPDSNTDTGAINSITVRVKNQNGFDGRKTNEQGEALGDWEDVRLVETGKNTGVFKGWAATTSLPSTTGDQKIGVQAGDTLDVYYNDYVRMAGEYDEKLHVQVTVVSPIMKATGAHSPQSGKDE